MDANLDETKLGGGNVKSVNISSEAGERLLGAVGAAEILLALGESGI